MSSRLDVSTVPLLGGYIAKRCPVVIQNQILVPELKTESAPEDQFWMDAGILFEAETLETMRTDEPGGWVVIPQHPPEEATLLHRRDDRSGAFPGGERAEKDPAYETDHEMNLEEIQNDRLAFILDNAHL
jgi:hypothetical protein